MLALCVAVGLTGCDTSVTPLEDSDPAPEQPSSSDLSVALLPGGMQHASSEDGPSYRCTANVLAPEAAEDYRTYNLALAFPDSVHADSSSETESEFARLNLALSLEPTADSTTADSTARQMASRIRCNVPSTEEALHLIADRIETDLQAQFGEDGYRFADSDSSATGNAQSSGQGGAAVSSKYVQDDPMDCSSMYDPQPSCDMDLLYVSADGGGNTFPIYYGGPIDIPPPPDPSGPGDDGSSDPGGGSSDPADCTSTLQGPTSASTTAHPTSGSVPTWLIPQPDADPGSDLLDPDYPDNPTPADPPGGTECDEEPEEEEPSTEEQLEALLEEDPYALLDIPCDKVSEWSNLSQHQISQEVIDRMLSVLPSGTPGWHVQTLENAAGAVINLDQYGVAVPESGIPNGWTPEQYLEHIRTNINSFIDTDISRFEFYPGIQNENTKWIEDPLGTLFSIQLVAQIDWLDDGTVVTSSYSPNEWTFSTLYTPEDLWHPVSGHRRFGFTENGDGTVTFYTRGVDRISNDAHRLGNLISGGQVFDSADALWESLQEGIASDIGAQSTISEPVTYRPDYDQVAAVLDGDAPPSSLGCN